MITANSVSSALGTEYISFGPIPKGYECRALFLTVNPPAFAGIHGSVQVSLTDTKDSSSFDGGDKLTGILSLSSTAAGTPSYNIAVPLNRRVNSSKYLLVRFINSGLVFTNIIASLEAIPRRSQGDL